MTKFVCDEMDPNFLFPYETISKITKNTIKTTKEVKKQSKYQPLSLYTIWLIMQFSYTNEEMEKVK
jgi:hypothetical protein